MSPSLWQILIVVILLVLLFGRGKISSLMGDVAKGIKSFKKGMAEDDTTDGTDRVAGQVTAERVENHERHGGGGTIDVTPEARKDRA